MKFAIYKKQTLHKNNFLVVASLLAIFIVISAACSLPAIFPQPTEAPKSAAQPNLPPPAAPVPAAVGKTASDFILSSLDGKQVRLSSYQGKPMLLVFFATWCPHCQNEAPLIEKVYQANKAKGLEVLAVSTFSQTPPTLVADSKNFAKQYGWSFTVVVDQSNLAQGYGVTGVPTNIGIDKSGVVRYLTAGELNEAGLNKWVADLLAK